MKFLLLAAFALTAAFVGAQQLPDVLVQRAREVIRKAEAEVHRHHEAGHQHLTHELELEIEEVRKLERELLALEQTKHVETQHAHEVELRLLAHENRLSELIAVLEVGHRREEEQNNPQALVRRAQELIKRAEYDLRRHHEAQRQHLTQALEQEIQAVRHLETQLVALERANRLSSHNGQAVLTELQRHEKRLAELSTAVEQHQTGHEGRNRERPPQ